MPFARRFKLIRERRELFDLEQDPHETRNLLRDADLADDFEETAAKLAELLERLEGQNAELVLGRQAGETTGDELVITPEERQQLEALGYLD